MREVDEEELAGRRAGVEEELVRYGMPAALIPGTVRYIVDHVETGHFLAAILRNDLVETVTRADHENVPQLKQIVDALNMVVPAPAWGSPEKVQAWLAMEAGEL